MASKRIARLNEQLKREVASLLLTDVRDPRVGPVVVTGVRVAPDLTSARVYVRLSGLPAERAASLEGLVAAAPFLRGSISRVLRIRRVPELRFREDSSFDHAQRIEQILSEVLPPGRPEDTARAEDGGGEEPDEP
jgi:ribosome-binding factor A